MEALAAMTIAAVLGFLAGGAREALRARGSGRGAETTAGVLKDLVAEHLGLARDRLGAAEARIALLEERLAFHDGFLSVTPRDAGVPAETLPVRVERVARARHRGNAPETGRPRAADAGILPFPTTSGAAEETPNTTF